MSPKQGVRNPPSKDVGFAALQAIVDSYLKEEEPVKKMEQTAVKYCLQLLHEKAPGNSVEVRIPPHAAVQVISGLTHRRGTPPAVIEMNARTWIELAIGKTDWDSAKSAGLVLASGQRADLSTLLPLVSAQNLGK